MIVTKILNYFFSVFQDTKGGSSALVLAARSRHKEAAKALLEVNNMKENGEELLLLKPMV